MMQEAYPISQDLEEASTEYAEKAYYHPVDRNVGKADFIMGAQWHQQQMMKEAIKADVRVDVPVSDDYVYIRAYIKQEKLKVGDKVKLIIIKED